MMLMMNEMPDRFWSCGHNLGKYHYIRYSTAGWHHFKSRCGMATARNIPGERLDEPLESKTCKR